MNHQMVKEEYLALAQVYASMVIRFYMPMQHVRDYYSYKATMFQK